MTIKNIVENEKGFQRTELDTTNAELATQLHPSGTHQSGRDVPDIKHCPQQLNIISSEYPPDGDRARRNRQNIAAAAYRPDQ
jgi:hypothetical protein